MTPNCKLSSQRRICKASLIILYYKEWCLLMHKHYLLENETSYKDNENTVQFFRALTGMDINISEMYQPDDTLCNEIIAHNEVLESFEHRNLLEALNTSKNTMESFCKSVYYGDKCWFLHSDSGRLSTLFGMLLSYAIGNFDKSQLIKELSSKI